MRKDTKGREKMRKDTKRREKTQKDAKRHPKRHNTMRKDTNKSRSRCLFVCEVQYSLLILVVNTLLVHFPFQLIKVGSSGYYSKINKTICCKYEPCIFAFYNVFFVSSRVFSCLFMSFHVFPILVFSCVRFNTLS